MGTLVAANADEINVVDVAVAGNEADNKINPSSAFASLVSV